MWGGERERGKEVNRTGERCRKASKGQTRQPGRTAQGAGDGAQQVQIQNARTTERDVDGESAGEEEERQRQGWPRPDLFQGLG